jgi:hypothetical protein
MKKFDLKRSSMEFEYSQGVSGDGPVVLKDGQPMNIDQIVDELIFLQTIKIGAQREVHFLRLGLKRILSRPKERAK